MAWSYWVVNTLTGERQLEVFPSAGSCRPSLTSVGSGSHEFKLRDTVTALPRATVRDLFLSWIRTLVVCWDEQPVYAGLITGGKWDRDSGTLTVDHRELRGIFSKRFAWMVSTYPSLTGLPWSWKVTGKTLRGLMRAVVQRGAHSVPGDNWHLPVVLPADESGSRSFEEWAFNFRSIEQMITDLQDMDGGPDVYFRPRWGSSGALEWVCEIGNPVLSGGVLERNAPPPMSDVYQSVVTLDSAGQLSGVFGLGEGTEQDMKVGLAGPLAGTPIPDMDAKIAFKNAATQADVNAQSMGELRLNRETIRQDDKKAFAQDLFPVGIGGTVREWLDGDEFLDDGWTSGYIIGLGMTVGSDVVTVEVQ